MNMQRPSIADFLPSMDVIANNLIIYAQPGRQGRRTFYTAMLTLETIASLTTFDESSVMDQEKAQRPLTQSRIPAIATYLGSDEWVFGSITVALESDDVKFFPLTDGALSIGALAIPRTLTWRIVDGQHRTAGIREAIKKYPERRQETVAVDIYVGCSIGDLRQIFRDKNYFGAKPSTSLSIAFNNRDQDALLANSVHKHVPIFWDLTELNKNQPADRSDKLFSMNNLFEATKRLLKGYPGSLEDQVETAIAFWKAVAEDIPYWGQVHRGELSAKECRSNTVCSLGVVLAAIGSVGRHLIETQPEQYLRSLEGLRKINWRKSNPKWAEIIFGPDGKVVKSNAVVNKIADYLWEELTQEKP